MLSLGERRVRTTFSPASDQSVDIFKNTTVALIDELERRRTVHNNPERDRLIDEAQKAYELAAMWAVKAATSP
jgi:hypothetical protein